jgi:multiple sugar transport system substrate-binding protein
VIDPAQPIPLYFQLKTHLLEAILRGEYGPGARLPTEHELCDRFGISRTPVIRALTELAEEGVVLRYRRRGTFVNPHWIPRRSGLPEVRVLLPEGPWERMLRQAAPTDIQINVVSVPRPDLHRVLTHAVAEGQAPDLAVIDSVWVAELAGAGFLYSLEELDESWVRKELETDFLEALVAAGRYQGGTFGVSSVADVAGLWYRRDGLERIGAGPPQTWQELRSQARALAADGVPHPLVLPGGSRGGETTTYCLLSFLASNGVAVLSADGVGVASKAAVQALRFLRDLVADGLVFPDVVALEWDQPVRILARGQAAFSLGGSYEARGIAETLGVPVDELLDHVGFSAVPAGPAGVSASIAGTMMYGVFRQAENPLLAMRLLKAVVAPDVLARIAAATGRIPPRRSAIALAAVTSPLVSLTAGILAGAATRPATPLYPRVSAQLQVMLESVLTRRLGPADAARRAAEIIAAITGAPVVREQ